MPVIGTRDLTADAAAYAGVDLAAADDSVVFETTEIVQLLIQIDATDSIAMLPPALHPTVPPSAVLTGYKFAAGPWGAFELVELRINTRLHDRPRALLVGAIVNDDGVATRLRDRYGYRIEVGDVRIRRYYDRVEMRADVDGRPAVRVDLIDPDPVPAMPLPAPPLLNIAVVDGAVQLLPIDPVLAGTEAERGRPMVHLLATEEFGDGRVRPVDLIAIWYAVATMTLPPPGKPLSPGGTEAP